MNPPPIKLQNSNAAKAKVDGFRSEKASLTSNTTRTGRTSHRTNRATDTDALDELLDKIVEAKLEQRAAKAAEKKVKDESDEVCASFEKWKEKFAHPTPDSLMAHGKSILQPAGDYYRKLFMEEDGDCYNIRKMSEAALIFDPIELSKLSDADIVL
jgi:Ribonuclease G/E